MKKKHIQTYGQSKITAKNIKKLLKKSQSIPPLSSQTNPFSIIDHPPISAKNTLAAADTHTQARSEMVDNEMKVKEEEGRENEQEFQKRLNQRFKVILSKSVQSNVNHTFNSNITDHNNILEMFNHHDQENSLKILDVCNQQNARKIIHA